jgi:DNA topoisomerase-1
VLATDPDREGEAISWHILELLTQKGIVRPAGENGKGRDAGGAHLPKEGGRQTYPAVQRVTFTEVTKSAVLAAFSNPRQVSEALVDAYLARPFRVLTLRGALAENAKRAATQRGQGAKRRAAVDLRPGV